MNDSTMTPRERWLAALELKPTDRLPFWPKLDGAYTRAQATPFRDMDLDEIQDWIGADKHKRISLCAREKRSKTEVVTTKSGSDTTITFRGSHGETSLVRRFDEASQSTHPIRHPVANLSDIQLMTEICEDTTVELDPEALETARSEAKEIGESALTVNFIGTSPLMDWVEFLAGVEEAHFLLNDHKAEVEHLFEAMHRVLLEKVRIHAEHSPADALYLVENTSTTLISPDQYRKYCLPHKIAYATEIQRAGRTLILHMCGHLKALLPDLATIPAQAFEAFTSPTLGNTTLLDGREACPDKCLIGGTNAMLWTRPASEIINQIEADLNDLPHHRGVVVTSAGIMPPLCEPATIKAVCEWVKTFPAIMAA